MHCWISLGQVLWLWGFGSKYMVKYSFCMISLAAVNLSGVCRCLNDLYYMCFWRQWCDFAVVLDHQGYKTSEVSVDGSCTVFAVEVTSCRGAGPEALQRQAPMVVYSPAVSAVILGYSPWNWGYCLWMDALTVWLQCGLGKSLKFSYFEFFLNLLDVYILTFIKFGKFQQLFLQINSLSFHSLLLGSHNMYICKSMQGLQSDQQFLRLFFFFHAFLPPSYHFPFPSLSPLPLMFCDPRQSCKEAVANMIEEGMDFLSSS